MKYCQKEDDVFYHTVMTKTKTNTKTTTKCIEDPTYAIFLKSRELMDIKYDQTRPDQDRPGQRRKESRTYFYIYIYTTPVYIWFL